MKEIRREPEVPEEKSPSGRMSRWPCKDYLKGTCNNSFCEKGHPPECLFYKTKSGCRFGEKCSYAHRQVDEQPTERSKKNDDKSAVAMLKKGDWHESVWEPVINYGHHASGGRFCSAFSLAVQRERVRLLLNLRFVVVMGNGCLLEDCRQRDRTLRPVHAACASSL